MPVPYRFWPLEPLHGNGFVLEVVHNLSIALPYLGTKDLMSDESPVLKPGAAEDKYTRAEKVQTHSKRKLSSKDISKACVFERFVF